MEEHRFHAPGLRRFESYRRYSYGPSGRRHFNNCGVAQWQSSGSISRVAWVRVPPPLFAFSFNRPVAQWRERRSYKPIVVGSIPTGAISQPCHRSPTGRGSGLRNRSVQVRILPVVFRWDGSSNWESACLANRRLRVRVPPIPLAWTLRTALRADTRSCCRRRVAQRAPQRLRSESA